MREGLWNKGNPCSRPYELVVSEENPELLRVIHFGEYVSFWWKAWPDYPPVRLDVNAQQGELAEEEWNSVRNLSVLVSVMLSKMDYARYLQTHYWQRRRHEALARAGHACQLCNSHHRLEVHHRTYKRRGWEYPEDLIVLCSHCHAKFHDKLPIPR